MGLAVATELDQIDPASYQRVVALTFDATGIRLGDAKQRMVSGRLRRLVHEAGLTSYAAYLEYAQRDPAERSRLLDSLTTNETYFFREPAHFDRLQEELAAASAPWTVWSAASSTGEEPYSLAITLREYLPKSHQRGSRILATDVSPSVIAEARRAVYSGRALAKVPPDQLETHFEDRGDGRFQVKQSTRSLVTFARLNLMGPWPMKGPFDLVLLRNVMIYFDEPTRCWLVERIAALVRPGGYLFIGHSETLGEDPATLQRLQPAVYRRTDVPAQIQARPR
ncbi:MAG: protein-glutamate O-methyltransferase CheR [Myxococcota bacterium]